MKHSNPRFFVFALILALLILACGGTAPAAEPAAPTPAVDVVQTAIAQTQVAQALAQATVNASALTSIPPTYTPAPPVEGTTMSEEELAALIEQTVNEAITAAEETYAATTTVTSDSAVTSEEVVYVYEYYYDAEYYAAYAEELLAEYYDLYSALAQEMMTELNAIESQLTQVNDSLAQISVSLEEINATLSQGMEAAQESIAELQQAAEQAQASAQALKQEKEDMLAQLQLDQQKRLEQIQSIQPSNIPVDKLSALHSAFDFLESTQAALGDSKLSRDELLNIAQLGKNAQAGFQQFGGAAGGVNRPGAGGGQGMDVDLTQFSGKFDEITTQFARGEIPAGRENASGFQQSLGTRPARR